MVLLTHAEKAFDNIHLFMIKMSNKLGIEVKYLKIIKPIYDKLSANIILSGEN